jgi:lysophospholipase L1-like esterase
VIDALREEEHGIGLSFDLKEDQYSVVLISLGTNDIFQELSPEFNVIPNSLRLLKVIPLTMKVGIFGFPFEEKASKRLQTRLPLGVAFLPFPLLDQQTEWLHEDGTHLNEKGLQEMKKRIECFILETLAQKLH